MKQCFGGSSPANNAHQTSPGDWVAPLPPRKGKVLLKARHGQPGGRGWGAGRGRLPAHASAERLAALTRPHCGGLGEKGVASPFTLPPGSRGARCGGQPRLERRRRGPHLMEYAAPHIPLPKSDVPKSRVPNLNFSCRRAGCKAGALREAGVQGAPPAV